MNRIELVKLKRLVQEEIKKRDRVKELLRNDLVQEYLRLTNTEESELDSNNLNEIIEQVLNTFTISKTNGIYVCTSAWYRDCHITYEDTDYYSVDVDIDSKDAEHKIYVDIESKERIHAAKDVKENPITKYGIDSFEKGHIVLNPYNTNKNNNGYDEVRYEFFKNAIELGQPKSRQMILSKYPRL